MSDYRHEPRKFADAGLQLRLPVDLIPPTQYGRMTNGLPVIEGQLTTRDGMTLLANLTQVLFGYELLNSNPLVTTDCDTILTPYESGFIVGDAVVINVIYLAPSQTNSIVTGTYTVTITAIDSVTPTPSLTFTPAIACAPSTPVLVFAQITSLAALNVLSSTPITNLFRLNQSVSSYTGDRIAVMNGRVFHAPLPLGDVFEELVGPIAPGSQPPSKIVGFSGKPMSIIEFRFTKDTVSWALFADPGAMYKFRPGAGGDDTQIEFAQLGNAPPTAVATYSAGGVGNLNSTGGTGYDWRYTYMDGFALTEGNPSPINITGGGTSTTRPTTFTNPAISGDVTFGSPGNAIDGSTTTSSGGGASTSSSSSTAATQQASCQWDGWAQPAGVVSSVILNVNARLTAEATTEGVGNANATATLSYSFDFGGTWSTLKSITVHGSIAGNSIDTGQQTYTATIPSAAAFANIIVRGVAYSEARGSVRFGEVFTSDASAGITIWDINTTVVQEGSTNALALTNQIGKVCVTPSPYPQHTFINLYRRGGSLPDNWRLVGQFPISSLVQGTCGAGTLEIDDNVSDTTLSTQPLLELDNDQPITSVTATNVPLSFIWGPAGVDARVLGCGDSSRPECVYFSKPGNADAWPPQNFIEVSSPGTPIIAGCVFNTRNFAFSQESVYELVEGLGTGTTYTPFRTPSAHGLYAPQALAIGPFMYFVAKDGIYMSTGGQEVSIVENDIKPLFPTYDTPGESIEGYEAVDYTHPNSMRLRYHNDELYFCYRGRDSGLRQVLVYDILKKRWRNVTTTCGISEVYTEPNTVSSLLYGTVAGTIYVAGGNFDPSDLDVIENVSTSFVTAPTTLGTATYYVRVVRYDTFGAAAMSYESSVAVTPTSGIQVTFPPGNGSTQSWRVYYGTTSGQENQYQSFTEAFLAGTSRTVAITAAGTAGTLPATNASNAISVNVRTGAHDQGVPLNKKQYGNVIIDLDPGGATNAAPVTITPYINGEVQTNAALTVTGTGRQQVPLDISDYFAFNTEYEVKWTRTSAGGIVTNPVLYQYDTLYFLEPVEVTHWQSQPTAFEFPGFMHCRDMYVAIRSTAPATLTMTVDNGTATPTVQTYTIPSTAGERRKIYIQFAPNKGLLYQFAVDSTTTAGFRLYASDLEIRVKPWLGVMGYAIQRTIGGEAGA